MPELEELTHCHSEAFDCIAAVAFEHARAATSRLTKQADLGKSHKGIVLGRGALSLLPTVHTRILDRSDQQFMLSGFTGIASNVCALPR